MQELLQMRQIYLEGLGKLLRERADLYAVFQSQQIVCFESHLPSQGFARTFDAAEQLSENLREEQRIWTQMIAVTFRRVSCVQLMRVRTVHHRPCSRSDQGLRVCRRSSPGSWLRCLFRLGLLPQMYWLSSTARQIMLEPDLNPIRLGLLPQMYRLSSTALQIMPEPDLNWLGLPPQMYWLSSTVHQIMLEPDLNPLPYWPAVCSISAASSRDHTPIQH